MSCFRGRSCGRTRSQSRSLVVVDFEFSFFFCRFKPAMSPRLKIRAEKKSLTEFYFDSASLGRAKNKKNKNTQTEPSRERMLISHSQPNRNWIYRKSTCVLLHFNFQMVNGSTRIYMCFCVWLLCTFSLRCRFCCCCCCCCCRFFISFAWQMRTRDRQKYI